MAVSDEPLVSVDYIGNTMSSTIDALSTNNQVLEARALLKIRNPDES